VRKVRRRGTVDAMNDQVSLPGMGHGWYLARDCKLIRCAWCSRALWADHLDRGVPQDRLDTYIRDAAANGVSVSDGICEACLEKVEAKL